jgi:hypothetical protein
VISDVQFPQVTDACEKKPPEKDVPVGVFGPAKIGCPVCPAAADPTFEAV